MKHKVAIQGLVFLSLFVINSSVRAQDPASSPSPSPSPEVVATQPATPPAAAPTPETDFWKREQMTGDWDGDRLRWKEKGLEIELSLTQFYQGVADGGIRRGSEYNGVFKTNFKFDLGKMAGWKWWSAQVQTETRFGGPLLGGTGTINPVNTAAIIPGTSGGVFSVTAVNFTRLIPIDLAKGNLYVVGFGRYNLLDLVDEQFFGGSGLDRFFNIAQNGPLTAARQVPLITNGATFAYLKGGEPRFTLAVLDPNDQSTDPGLDHLFADGVTFAPTVFFPAKYFGKTAKHSFGGAITTKAYTPFDDSRQIISTDLSSVLKDNLNLLTQAGRRPRAEHQLEMFYNLHITPWLRLTGDLQVIRPTRAIATTAIIPGARLAMTF